MAAGHPSNSATRRVPEAHARVVAGGALVLAVYAIFRLVGFDAVIAPIHGLFGSGDTTVHARSNARSVDQRRASEGVSPKPTTRRGVAGTSRAKVRLTSPQGSPEGPNTPATVPGPTLPGAGVAPRSDPGGSLPGSAGAAPAPSAQGSPTPAPLIEKQDPAGSPEPTPPPKNEEPVPLPEVPVPPKLELPPLPEAPTLPAPPVHVPELPALPQAPDLPVSPPPPPTLPLDPIVP